MYTPGLGSVVVWIAIRILLRVVGVLVQSERRTVEIGPVAVVRISPVPFHLFRDQWRVALVLRRTPVIVISVFWSGGVMARPGTRTTSVVHDDPLTQDQATRASNGKKF